MKMYLYQLVFKYVSEILFPKEKLEEIKISISKIYLIPKRRYLFQ